MSGVPTPVTSVIQPTSALFTLIEARLEEYDGWTIKKFSGTSVAALFNKLPELPLPCAVIVYEGSKYYDHPERRRARFHVVVAKRVARDLFTKHEAVFVLHEKAIELLDGRVLGGTRASCYVVTDDGLDLGPSIDAVDVVFEIADH